MAVHTYKGKPVSKLRDVKEGDAGFDAKAGPQLWIRDAEGKEFAVKHEELTRHDGATLEQVAKLSLTNGKDTSKPAPAKK